jgi:hypothetical protein
MLTLQNMLPVVSLSPTRYAALTTNKGRVLSWGFKDVPGSTKAAVEAPVPGAYVAAFRGFEGKPAPVAKKRYGGCGAGNFGVLGGF